MPQIEPKTEQSQQAPPASIFNEYRDWFVLLGAISSVARTITFGVLGFIHGDLPHNTGDDLYYFYNDIDQASKEIAGQSYGGIAAGIVAGKSYWLARMIQRLKELGKNRSSYQPATTMEEESKVKIAKFIKKYFSEEFKRLKDRLNDENGIEHAATLVGVLTGIGIAAAMCKISLTDTLQEIPIPMVNETCIVLGVFLTIIGNIGTFGGAFGRATRAPARIKNNIGKNTGTLDRTYEILIVAALITTVALLIVYNLHCPLNFFIFLHMVELVGAAMGGAGYIGQAADFVLDLDGYKGKRRSLTTIFSKPWSLKKLEWNHQNRATVVGLGFAGALAPVLLTLLPKIILAFVLTRFLPPGIAEAIFVLAVINIVVGASRRIGRAIDGYYGNLAKAKAIEQQQQVEGIESQKEQPGREPEIGIVSSISQQPKKCPTEIPSLMQDASNSEVKISNNSKTPAEDKLASSISSNHHSFFVEPKKEEKLLFANLYRQIEVRDLSEGTRNEIIVNREQDTREIRREQSQKTYTEKLCNSSHNRASFFALPNTKPTCGKKIDIQKFAAAVPVATL